MSDSDNGDGNNQGFASLSMQEKGSRNKRKYLAEFSLEVPTDASSSSLMEFPRYELLEEKFRTTPSELGSLETGSDSTKEEQEVDEFQSVDWDDPITCQLEDLLLHDLCAIFSSAIKKIVKCGYSEEAAESAVLRTGLCYGGKDAESNIMDGALLFLRREKEFHPPRHNVFEDLQNMVKYTMLEMIYVLREVKPILTVAEAMWCLLIYDLNLSHACAVEGDPFSAFCGNDVSRESSSDSTLLDSKPEGSEISLPKSDRTYISKPLIPNTQDVVSQSPNQKKSFVRDMTIIEKESLVPTQEAGVKALEEKCGCSRKGCSGNSTRDMLRQKTFHFEKTYKGRMSRGAFKAKFTSWGSMVMNKMKYPSDSSGVIMKSTSKISTGIGFKVPLPDGIHHPSSNALSVLAGTDNHCALPLKDTLSASPPETKPTPKTEVNIPGPSKTPDYYVGIPYDMSRGKYDPQDDKDEMILTLVPWMQVLQKELQGWTDWANEKVMQAARRLSKDQAELKTLKQEKEETEKFEKEKQISEENTMKRLSEMENALAFAAGQTAKAHSTVRKLEVENFVVKHDMDAARLYALESASNLQEAVLREQDTLKKAQSWKIEKGLCHEEFTSLKRNPAELQQQLGKAKDVQYRIEARRKEEEKEKVGHLTLANTLRREREHSDAVAKAEEDMTRQKAENVLQKYKEDIKKLESEIFELSLESESSKIAALRRGVDLSYGNFLTEPKGTFGTQASKVTKRLAVFRDNFGAGSVKPHRECVMCLTDEMCTVFVPCAHQVLCAKCNVLHEKQGMNDCPSCRTLIQRRINVRYAT